MEITQQEKSNLLNLMDELGVTEAEPRLRVYLNCGLNYKELKQIIKEDYKENIKNEVD